MGRWGKTKANQSEATRGKSKEEDRIKQNIPKSRAIQTEATRGKNRKKNKTGHKKIRPHRLAHLLLTTPTQHNTPTLFLLFRRRLGSAGRMRQVQSDPLRTRRYSTAPDYSPLNPRPGGETRRDPPNASRPNSRVA